MLLNRWISLESSTLRGHELIVPTLYIYWPFPAEIEQSKHESKHESKFVQ